MQSYNFLSLVSDELTIINDFLRRWSPRTAMPGKKDPQGVCACGSVSGFSVFS